ncbi:MAG: helix-turn-helix transcriptional regulator [Gammaproteobacteria bacterium]|nr:helix-turn-helix transcriptional regulator [Gammaproteobacteria bacterium]
MNEHGGHITITGETLARLRTELGASQKQVAKQVRMDPSRLSRLEKGDVGREEFEPVLDALARLGSESAEGLKDFLGRTWRFIDPPSYWNPERSELEVAEDTLGKIEQFLAEEEQPWPLRRQLERRRDELTQATTYLSGLRHNIAFVGDIGVGKSTAISHLFELMAPVKSGESLTNQPVLESGAGGTTICEVQVKTGPEFGISLVPLEGSQLLELVSDFCTAKWEAVRKEGNRRSDIPQVAREVERAIRNMANLTRKKRVRNGKPVYEDPVHDLVVECENEDEVRARVLQRMELADRTTTEIWYGRGSGEDELNWTRDTFRAVNNGRRSDVPFPKRISLLMPCLAETVGELEITIIDTKGVSDLAVREDLDARLKEGRTSVVLCCRFNDAPGTSVKALLQHMKHAVSERFELGKLAILGLPRSGEAREMKDDDGELALTDDEGYEFKKMQVEDELTAEDMPEVPMLFLNVERGEGAAVLSAILAQVTSMRESMAQRVVKLCDGATEIIENQEREAVAAAIEEVNRRLITFLDGNDDLAARERHAYQEVLDTVSGARYASTIWAATRRKGEYYGLNVIHQVGVGAAKDAQLRTRDWLTKVEGHVNTLNADAGLALARRSIDLIKFVAASRLPAFQEAAQRNAMEIYRAPLSQDSLWLTCLKEWGKGPGYTDRIVEHLRDWFESKPELKEMLETRMQALWARVII